MLFLTFYRNGVEFYEAEIFKKRVSMSILRPALILNIERIGPAISELIRGSVARFMAKF